MPSLLFLRDRRLLIFALAYAGGVIGYLPLLTLLLPMKIAAIAPDARIGVLTVATLSGAVAASLSNILFGAWSDRMVAGGGGRRPIILGGVAATATSYAMIGASGRPGQVILSVVLFQVAINAVLAPLMAMMADDIPDDRKGVAGGLLALANPMASAVTAIVVASTWGEASRLAIVAAAMAACILPLLSLSAALPIDAPAQPAGGDDARGDLKAMWLARLLVQIANVILFHYLLYYLQSVATDLPPATLAVRAGELLVVAYILPLPVALLFGRASDRTGARRPFLLLSALLAAGSLCGMALATGWQQAAILFCGYAVGSATFLSIHATFAMQLLPSARHRGRDLGLLNLTNTLPALIGPVLTWAVAGPKDFSTLMLTLAVLTTLGGVATLAIHERA